MAAPTGSAPALSLRDKQKAGILRMLDLVEQKSATGGGYDTVNLDGDDSTWSNQWKLLIYDRFCRDVISPILKVGDLRKQGVTLHMLIDSDREEIPDVPAIYFIQPNETNVGRLTKDLASRLYTSFYLNFVSPLPRSLLESIAKATVESDSTSLVQKVYDQYLNFVCLEPQLFTLNMPNSYISYNNRRARDNEIQASMESIAQGLFSVLATYGEVPIIRCAPGGPGEVVAMKLYTLLRDHLVGKSEIFSGSFSSGSFHRPVLVIVDRNDDIAAALHHASTYQALIDDLVGINMNRVVVNVSSASGKQRKTYDFDTTTDPFFRAHARDLFPDAIAANEEEMKRVTKQEEDIRAKAGGKLDVALGLPGEGSSTKGSFNDKQRLAMIYHLSTSASSTEISEIEEAITRAVQALSTADNPAPVADFRALRYLKKNAAFRRKPVSMASDLGTVTVAQVQSDPSSVFKGLAGAFGAQAQGWLDKATASVKNFLPTTKKLNVTRVVDNICEIRQGTEDDSWIYLDPKVKPTASGEVPRLRTPFRDAIVFVIGGGNYVEFQNLQDYCAAQVQPRNVIYGCTELLSPEKFLEQLSVLGSE